MKKITSFNHACKVLKRNPSALPGISKLPKKVGKYMLAIYKLTTIIEAQNVLNNWQPDWNNSSQYKYYPWLWVRENKKNPSGFGLSCHDYADTRSFTAVGSRLVVGTSDEAKYIFEKFKALYEDWMLIDKK